MSPLPLYSRDQYAAPILMPAPASRARAFAALAAAGCLWGTGFLFGKWALTELSVGQLVLYRFLFASIGFAPATWRALRRVETRVARQDFSLIFVAALLGVPVQFLIQFSGLARTTVSHASLMIGILPVLLAAGSALFVHERVTKGRWIALVTSMLGAALIAFGASTGEAGAQASVGGDLLIAGSLITSVAWILICQRLMKTGRYSPVSVSAYVMTLGALMLAVWVIGTEGFPTDPTFRAHVGERGHIGNHGNDGDDLFVELGTGASAGIAGRGIPQSGTGSRRDARRRCASRYTWLVCDSWRAARYWGSGVRSRYWLV